MRFAFLHQDIRGNFKHYIRYVKYRQSDIILISLRHAQVLLKTEDNGVTDIDTKI